jgi:hypothetical protein
MFELNLDETVIGSAGPLESDCRVKTCSHCAQIAFRVLHVKSQSGQREVCLCGAHFTEACARYPDVRRVAAMRNAG